MAPKVKPLPPPRISTTGNSANTGAAAVIRRTKLRYPELSEGQIARRVGCDPANVHRVLKRFLGDHSVEELRDFQDHKADIHDSLQLKALMSITDADIAKAPYLARVTGAAIHEDKARLIRGQATSINVSVLLDAVEAVRAMRREES